MSLRAAPGYAARGLYITLLAGETSLTRPAEAWLRQETFQQFLKGAAMSDTMQTPQPSASREEKPRRRFFRRAAIAAAIAAVAAGIGARALAQGGGHSGWHRAGFMGDQSDPAKLEEHLDRMLKHLYVEVDATDAQRLQLAPIVKSAARDLLPVHTKIHDARRQAVQLLSQDTVDRAALRWWRNISARRASGSRSSTKAGPGSSGSRASPMTRSSSTSCCLIWMGS